MGGHGPQKMSINGRINGEFALLALTRALTEQPCHEELVTVCTWLGKLFSISAAASSVS